MTNRESKRVKELLQTTSLGYILWGSVAIIWAFFLAFSQASANIFWVQAAIGVTFLLGGVWIRSQPIPKNLDIHGILLILFGIWTFGVAVYSISITGSSEWAQKSASTGFFIGAGKIYSGCKTLNSTKKTQRLIEEEYFLCPNCSFEQWSGYQKCQKCGHQF